MLYEVITVQSNDITPGINFSGRPFFRQRNHHIFFQELDGDPAHDLAFRMACREFGHKGNFILDAQGFEPPVFGQQFFPDKDIPDTPAFFRPDAESYNFV